MNLLRVCKATRIIADDRFLPTVLAAAGVVGLELSAILVFASGAVGTNSNVSISQLIAEGQQSTVEIPDKILAPGEGKTKAALIFFSSGTTGVSKARWSRPPYLRELTRWSGHCTVALQCYCKHHPNDGSPTRKWQASTLR